MAEEGKTRRERKRIARRTEMLDVAMEIVLGEGLDALTVARLAGELDASVGGLYRYFPSKGDLIVGLQQRAIGLFAAAMAEDVENGRAHLKAEGVVGDVRHLFLCIVALGGYLHDAERDSLRHRLMDEWMSTPEKLLSDDEAAQVEGAIAPMMQLIGSLLHSAAAAGALDEGDVAVRTTLAWAAMHGLDHFWKRDRIQPDHLQVRPLAIELLRTLMTGWGADAEAAREATHLWGAWIGWLEED